MSNAPRPRKSGIVLECDICGKAFENVGNHVPRLLPCTHTYCHICLTDLANGGPSDTLEILGEPVEVSMIKCPRGCGRVPVTDATSLPVNGVLINRLQRGGFDQSEEPTCEECDTKKTPADMWCDNCDAFFCGMHFTEMHQTRIGQRHRTMKASDKPNQIERCAVHAGQEIVLYCRTCKVCVCRDCCSQPFGGAHADSQKCSVVPLERAADEAAQDLRLQIKELRSTPLQTLQDGAREVQNQLVSSDTVVSSVKDDITVAFELAEANVLALLRQQRDDLLRQVSEVGDCKRSALQQQASEIGMAAAGLITVCGETEAELRTDLTSALHRAHVHNKKLQEASEAASRCTTTPVASVTNILKVPKGELTAILTQVIQEYGSVEDA
eukprot:TRINITY_DN3741_c2_g1_i2.p1 TRINITY_DN3741_c2_g1~~TRINITY_DN3741_c2_g1_i2.p1  ORF type:complete len:399 (+),score=78.50 TRINITY_DN3741_c2_g1_i2:49-1197(+)